MEKGMLSSEEAVELRTILQKEEELPRAQGNFAAAAALILLIILIAFAISQ